MTFLQLIASITALGLGLVLPITELVKSSFGMKDKRAILLTSTLIGALLGVVLAAGGLAELTGLQAFPVWASGLVVGVLAGLTASGGRKAYTNLQDRGAEARAKALVKAGVPVVEVPVVPVAATVTPVTPQTDPPLDEWRPATLEDLALPKGEPHAPL